ncbi:hypothetical protein BCR41DRAFT_389469 [Lobosporangium transversale]|uniref:Uncharacterized protein n=1 Tax=Lobosporangium transversale TaxID=64571 RepID=A0A1Y2GAK8_9FUNG|nr:hypothetical protein BCR41DRAFT_389469 [Lobosporangium transversale]ORZ05679.1 hypothetical protein BCR41DRAFT_389469 [Lobosporangium transversale]|eukprot:XP_021877166.1 hypothetical protein BCR41DRAFT_389469 [Lobosporangium transversale]
MGKSAKFFKRPTRKEKAVLSLTKGSAASSLFDAVSNHHNESVEVNKKKGVLSTTANPTIIKKGAGSAGELGAQPSKSSLAYKIQLNGGVKQAIKDMKLLHKNDGGDDDLMSEDEDMEIRDNKTVVADKVNINNNGDKKELDKTKPRPDYVELMYGKPQTGNKRKTFKPKPALIK